MTSDSWTQNNLCLGSISSDQNVSHQLLPAEAAHSGADGYITFPITPLQTSPLSTGNFFGNYKKFSSSSVHDLNMMTDAVGLDNYPINPAQNVIDKYDTPFSAYQFPTFPNKEANVVTSLECQTRDDMMTAYNRLLNEDACVNSIVGAERDRNFINASSNEVRNFHMNGFDEETRNNNKQLRDINRFVPNFSAIAPEIQQKVDVVERADDNQVRVNAVQPECFNKLDGRFLSLGYQSNSSFDIQSDACGRNVSNMTESSFSIHGQSANISLNDPRGNISGFQNNVGGLLTREYAGNLTLSHNDYNVWHDTNSVFDRRSIPVLPGGETNTHPFIPTPSNKISRSGNEDSMFSSGDTSKSCGANPTILPDVSGNRLGLHMPIQREVQRIPFNSSVLRSNHQNASDQRQISYLRPSVVSPPFGGINEEPGRQDQLGLVLGSSTSSAALAVEGEVAYRSHMVHPSRQVDRANVASYAGSGKGHDFESRIPQSASQEAATSVKGELSHPSNTCSRESLKRRSHLPSPAYPPDQRRKIMPLTSMYTFSPHLLQDVLGQTGKSTPAFTSCSNPSLTSTSVVKRPTASGSTKNQTAFPAEASVSQTLIPVASSSYQVTSFTFPSATMSPAASFANISPIPVVAKEGPSLFSLPNISTPTNLATAAATPNSSRRVVPEAFPPSTHIPAPVTAPRKTLLPRTSSALTSPAVSSLRKSLPALAPLAKASPAVRASPGPASMPRIRWQGFKTPQPSGVKCLLCKRDLSYTPEGPVSIPPIPPAVAILPCGHTFHDHCLLLITPSDQSKDPPCIPCAIGEK